MLARFLACAIGAVAIVGFPHAGVAAPGATLAAERARLALDRGLTPLAPQDGDPSRYRAAPPVPADAMPGGRDGWAITATVRAGVVASESLDVTMPGKPYEIFSAGRALFVRAFGAALGADLAASQIVSREQTDPDIVTINRAGKRFAYRIVDDQRNGIHTIAISPLAPAATVASDALYAVAVNGRLAPIAFRMPGAAFAPLPEDAAPPRRVHVIFGNRTVATLPTTVVTGQAQIAVPASVPLTAVDNALASPTLNGHAQGGRRALTAQERALALGLAAQRLHAPAAALAVRSLTAIDLGTGMAFAGTVNLRGSATPRIDHRLFFIAESKAGGWALTLANVQTIAVTEPLLEEPAEYLIDALDLSATATGLVTRIIGYDAATYAIYVRSGGGWKQVFSGGGAAN